MTRVIRAAPVIILCVLMLLPCGCWDRIEPDIIGLVTMIAFDLDEETGLFRVYAQLANPAGAGQQQDGGGGGGSGDGERAATWSLEAAGHTIFQAVRGLEILSTRRLLFSHVEAVLFSEALARRGIRPVIDFLERDPQVRLIARPFVVQGDLQKLMQVQFPLEQFGSTALSKQYVSVREEIAYAPETDSLRVMLHHLTMPGLELELPRIIVQKEAAADGENGAAARPNPVILSGMAAFRGDRLAGFFNGKETAGHMWLRSEVNRHYLVLQCPDHEDGLLSVEIYESSLELTPQISGDEVRFTALILVEGRIHEFSCQDFPLEEEFIASLNRRLATAIRNEAAGALDKGRELGTDVFGLGNLIYRTRNRDWQRFGHRWREMFPEVMVDLEVEAVIRRHGLNLAPVTIR